MNLYLWLQECKSATDRLINAVNQSAAQLVLRWGTTLGPMVFPFWGYALALPLTGVPCAHAGTRIFAGMPNPFGPALPRSGVSLSRPSRFHRRVPFLSGPPPASAGSPAPFCPAPLSCPQVSLSCPALLPHLHFPRITLPFPHSHAPLLTCHSPFLLPRVLPLLSRSPFPHPRVPLLPFPRPATRIGTRANGPLPAHVLEDCK
jgi:hypothetical protein